MVLVAVVGTGGLRPALAAIEAGKDLAVASKEILVMAGEIVMSAAREKGVQVLPVDSEHNAIFQCLEGKRPTLNATSTSSREFNVECWTLDVGRFRRPPPHPDRVRRPVSRDTGRPNSTPSQSNRR